jgi:hypothetical protein
MSMRNRNLRKKIVHDDNGEDAGPASLPTIAPAVKDPDRKKDAERKKVRKTIPGSVPCLICFLKELHDDTGCKHVDAMCQRRACCCLGAIP